MVSTVLRQCEVSSPTIMVRSSSLLPPSRHSLLKRPLERSHIVPMLQNVSSPVMENQANTIAMAAHQAAVIQSEVFIPSIDADGRISVPGFAHGLTVETYLPLVHLYTRILEASRILDRYRAQLRYQTNGCNAGQEQKPDQAPLTPLHASSLMPHLMYKREDLTVTRAYKVRGALVGMAKAMENQQYRRFIGVSTGNHALGLLKAAEILKPHSVRIVAPSNTAPWKLSKLEQAFAVLQEKGVQGELLLRGSTFDEARDWV